MLRNWWSELRKYLVCSSAALLAAAGVSRAQGPLPSDGLPLPRASAAPTAPVAPAASSDLKTQVEAQQKEIEELKAMIRSGALRTAAAEDADGAKKADPPAKALDEAAVNKIVEGYLKEHPGVGVPSGVQTGYVNGQGFAIRSTPDPKWSNWDDGSKIPFELRIRGRIQADYYFYQPTDSLNHLTGIPNTARGTGINPGVRINTSPTFSQLEIKRTRLIFEGTAFDPNLRYHIQLDGNTRGLTALAGGGVPAGNGTNSTGGVPGVADGNGVATVDHAVRLFSAYVAYDWHPCGYEKGCGPDCPEGTYRYTPTLTGIVGKIKPLFGLEEYLGSATEQFVEYSMADWFFDADDDNLLMAAGFQYKGMDDRLFVSALVTNGNETQIANLQMDATPGINIGGWYDFGGTWNEGKKKWDLFGDSIADVDWSCHPVVRVGGAVNLVPMDRRSEYDNSELNRVRAATAAPGGTTLLSQLGGGGINVNGSGIGQFAADAFDSYSFDAFWAAKYHGFSLYNEWWVRDLDNFRGRRAPTGAYPGNGRNQAIVYTSNLGATLFTANSLVDYGTTIQAGYFVVPKKLELAARWSYINGESGDINSTPTPGRRNSSFLLRDSTGATTRVNVIPGAFTHFHETDEYAVGVNYYFRRQLLKWQTDLGVYQGGNPAAGGQSPAGFIPGVDGWMVRTQIQLAF